MNFILILHYSFNIQRREPFLCDFFVKKKVLYSDIFRLISFRCGMMIETFILYILIPVLMTLTFIQGHRYIGNQKLSRPFSCKWNWFRWNWVCCHNLLVCWSSCQICLVCHIQGRELCWWDFMNICLALSSEDTYELICFKLGMLLNATILYSLIPVWMTLMVTQGHMVKGNLELVQSFCCKVAWSNSNVLDSWLCRGDGCEEVV